MSAGVAAAAVLPLLGLLVLPVLAHLTRRTPVDRQPYGAMMLLERLVKRLRRRRALRDVLLLLLRAAALAAAIAGVAAPYLAWQDPAPNWRGSGRVVVVVDRSMSMGQQQGGTSLLARGVGEVTSRLRALPDGAQVGLVTYARAAEAVTDALDADRERVAELLGALQPTEEPGDLRGALLAARKLLAGEPGEIWVVTDEAGPAMIPAAADEVARIVATGSALVPMPAHADPPRNVAVTDAAYTTGIEGGSVRLRLMGYGPDPVEVACEVVLPDGAEIPVFVRVPPQGEAEARVTVPREAQGGVGVVRCADPDLPGDDRRFFHLPSVGASRVLVVDGDPGDSPTRSEVFYLERALAPWGAEHQGVMPDIVSPTALATLDLSQWRVIFLANVSDPRVFAVPLRDFVRRGGNVVIAGGDNVTPDRYNEALGPVLPANLRQTRGLAELGDALVPLEMPDVRDPLLEPFARAGRGGFTKVGARRVLTLDPYPESDEIRTILRFQGGLPALVERTIGTGHVLLWTSTLDYGWTNLPLQAVYMPLIQRIVGAYGGDASSRAERTLAQVGQRVAIPVGEADGAEVTGPDGNLHPGQLEGSELVFVADKPGGYTVRIAGGPVIAWVAANTDPSESDVRRTTSLAKVEAEMDPELFERRVDLGPGLLASALGLLLVSAAIATRGVA